MLHNPLSSFPLPAELECTQGDCIVSLTSFPVLTLSTENRFWAVLHFSNGEFGELNGLGNVGLSLFGFAPFSSVYCQLSVLFKVMKKYFSYWKEIKTDWDRRRKGQL